MGFDFVVDASRIPWLVEVNRFPGLEPRDASDRNVKNRVLLDAWEAAAERLEMKQHPLFDVLSRLECNRTGETSLKHLMI